jgi:hypothetical protein
MNLRLLFILDHPSTCPALISSTILYVQSWVTAVSTSPASCIYNPHTAHPAVLAEGSQGDLILHNHKNGSPTSAAHSVLVHHVTDACRATAALDNNMLKKTYGNKTTTHARPCHTAQQQPCAPTHCNIKPQIPMSLNLLQACRWTLANTRLHVKQELHQPRGSTEPQLPPVCCCCCCCCARMEPLPRMLLPPPL